MVITMKRSCASLGGEKMKKRDTIDGGYNTMVCGGHHDLFVVAFGHSLPVFLWWLFLK